jgi:triacylglycerol esterase/lipase EstA (alpha/beta hydrolase family)
MAGAWIGVWWFWPRDPGWAVVGALAFVCAHAVVLAIECVVGAVINRLDPAPRAGWTAWLGAWWSETRVAPLVFAWRQPFCWRHLPDNEALAGEARTAVVLVHGFVCNRGLWLPWMEALRAQGVPYVSVNLEPVFGDIDDYDAVIEDAVRRVERLTGLPPIVVCHSMGGLAVRAWLARQSVRERVATVVTIGTPHRGTWLGRLSHVTNGRQMQPGCDWLVALEKREHGANSAPYANFVCWYSNTDNIVFPASTATLPGADNRLVAGAAHVAMTFHPAVMAGTMALVKNAPARV